MATKQEETQEQRTERITAMVTPTEKRAYRFVADAKNKTESDILREMSAVDVLAEYQRIRAVLEEAA